MKFVRALSICLFGAALIAPEGGAAQTTNRQPFTLVGLAELSRVFSPQLAPDGRTLAYFVSTTDWKSNRLVFHLWRQDLAGGAPHQLTFTEAGDQPVARWSPDSKTILFMRDGQFMLLPADGGEPRALTRHATSVSAPTWAPDGAAVYFVAADARTSDERERDRVRDDVYAFDENYKLRQLWKVVVSTGAETQVTTGPSNVNEYRLSQDGRRLAVERAPTPYDGDAYRGEIWVMDATGENARVLTSNAIEERGLELSPDNSQVLFVADANDRLEPYFPTTLFLVAATGGAPRAILSDFRHSIDQAAWAPDGRSIIATVNMGVHSEIVEIDAKSGRMRQLTDGAHFVPPGWSVVPAAGRIVFQLDEPTRFGDVWTLPLAAAGSSPEPTRVTRVFDVLDERALPRQEKVEWKGADDTNVEGILFYPLDYEPGRRYPLVVQLHAGPMESDKFGAGPGLVLNYFPVLTAKGYAVLRPNYRGSAGYGAAFMRDVNNGYFHNMATDVLAGIDHLVATGIADPDRLIVMGQSAGGTLVHKLITITDRFKAASAGAGVANWTSLWGQTDNTAFRRTWFGGTPWQKNAPADQFWASSPVKDVARVTTPTLLFAGDSDVRVPLAQAVEMYRALKSHNVPTHLYVGPREGHLWFDPRHLLYKANVELEWFAKYAGGGAYVWEKAPDAAAKPGA
jgi:dipeptidyl aminopeptidase/acylaminoacyl peptidase